MSDTTITPEERASWRERLENPFSCHDAKHGAFTLRLLTALDSEAARIEQAETSLQEAISKQAQMAAGIEKIASANHALAIKGKEQEERAEKAEAALATAMSMNAERQAKVTESVLNGLIAGITGQKQSVKVGVSGYQCPYCNVVSKTLEEATAHDAICPAHPAVIRAEQAEAENSRLTAERDWLARELWDFYPQKNIAELVEAARRAVAGEGEVRE